MKLTPLRAWTMVAFPGALIIVGMAVLLAILLHTGNLPAQHRLCDEMVEKLLTSPDLVEVVRAGIIVRRLDCSISRRLPP